MREIKFRYWNKAKRELVYFAKPYINTDSPTTDLVFPIDSKDNEYRSDLDTQWDEYIYLMQYTGLKDKNGVDVYEGDILLREVNFPDDMKQYLVVSWDEDCGRWEMQWIDKGEERDRFDFNGFTSWKMEVIGNIYEKPNLLENP